MIALMYIIGEGLDFCKKADGVLGLQYTTGASTPVNDHGGRSVVWQTPYRNIII